MTIARRTKNAAVTPPTYPIQLADVYLYEAQVMRSSRKSDDPDGPSLETDIITSEVLGGDEDHFTVRLVAEVKAPFRDNEAIAYFRTDVLGVFQPLEPVAKKDCEEFARSQAPLLLWPYLRAYTSELTRMTSLDVPILPTIHVANTIEALSTEMVDSSSNEHAGTAGNRRRKRTGRTRAKKKS